MRISVVIPVYEFHGDGVFLLDHQFRIFSSQVFKDFQLVITDHSVDNEIENFCKENKFNLNIKYIKNEESRGNFSANTNNGIKNSDGEIIKILFQDDFLMGNNSLLKVSNAFTNDVNWLVSSCVHSVDGVDFYGRFTPRYNDEIHHGINTISCPSVLSIRNAEDVALFDERLVWLMDVDYYKVFHEKFGNPKILDEVTVCIRTWEHQLSQSIDVGVKSKEHSIVSEKHD